MKNVSASTLSKLRPLPLTYVRCVENPLKEDLTVGRWYQVQKDNKIRKNKGEIGHSLAKFEPMSESYLNAFK